MPDFYYPYSFIRTPNREAVLGEKFVGDADPSLQERMQSHDRYWPERYSGEIPVMLRTETPLFITDPENKTDLPNGHASYSCLEEIPSTALKGMLSSAYEIITNSRYRVFSKRQHKKRLGYRSEARATLVPGRVTQEGDTWYVTLYTGTSKIGGGGAVERGNPLYAAWLPTYSGGETMEDDACRRLEHGKKYDHVKLGRYSHRNFDFWSVEEIDGVSLRTITRKAEFLGDKRVVSGYVVKTGKIFSNKHDERFFFNDSGNKEIRLKLSNDIRKAYEELIADYIRVHDDSATQPNNNRSVLGEHTKKGSKLAELKDGRFVYVKLDVNFAGKEDNDRYIIKGIYPVQIPRELYKVSPWDCLDDSLRPAETIGQLSPADRLFGWVSQEGKGAWRGKLRITNATYTGKGSPLEPVPSAGEDGRPLAILGSPKPAQARFYLGGPTGAPQKGGQDKEASGYLKGKKLRGRKVYLNHQNLSERTVFPDGIERTKQNRSIKKWIPKGRTFEFTIRFENLTALELGALLFLLVYLNAQDQPSCFRLGYGKPLGLGAVTLNAEIDKIVAFTGEEMKARYSTLSDAPNEPKTYEWCQNILIRFLRRIDKNYPDEKNFADSMVLGFFKAGKGIDGKITYSVIDGKPDEPSFQWFVQNEKKAGKKLALPHLGETLQSYPKEERPDRANRPNRPNRPMGGNYPRHDGRGGRR